MNFTYWPLCASQAAGRSNIMLTSSVTINIGEPFRQGSKVSAQAEANLATAVDELNRQLKVLGSHARVGAVYLDSGALLGLSVVDSLDF